MFEKEAEDRIRKLEERQTLGVYDNDEDLARDEGFNDGELYGYEEGFHDGAEFGYNKANEWHKITDWEDNSQFPDDESETYLVCLSQNHYVVCGVSVTEGYREFWLEDNLENIDSQDVLAWKEIVPPKE